jgi:beta-N-acetylhexosaminidase
MVDKNLIRDFGQLFIMAFDGPILSEELVSFFRTFRIGGLIFFADNFESSGQFSALITDIQARCTTDNLPMFITTDHEGGKRQEFRQGFSLIPPMAQLGLQDPDETFCLHRTIAIELRSAGINLNFAPVADLCDSRARGSIGDRSFGTDPELVSQHVSAAVIGLQQNGILSCVKHFPGHGPTRQNSHRELPVINLDMNVLAKRDLLPFKAAIAAGVSAVMTAHIVYPEAGDPRWPASLSPFWVSQVLRQQLGFEGIIITDALEMKALMNTWTPLECGTAALNAGADILMYYREKDQFQTFYELRLKLEKGELDTASIAQSLSRVYRLKQLLRPA